MARPTLGNMPTADELAAVECPVDRAAQITDLALNRRTLPKTHADIRLAAILEALAKKVTTTELAERLQMSVGRVSQLAGRARRATAPEESAA